MPEFSYAHPLQFRNPRHWHHNSEFGPGNRLKLDRDQRAKAHSHVRSLYHQHLLTVSELRTYELLLAMLNKATGQLDPSLDTIAATLRYCTRTVQRALHKLKLMGLVNWVRRIIRDRNTVHQTSNAYTITPNNRTNPPSEQQDISASKTRTYGASSYFLIKDERKNRVDNALRQKLTLITALYEAEKERADQQLPPRNQKDLAELAKIAQRRQGLLFGR